MYKGIVLVLLGQSLWYMPCQARSAVLPLASLFLMYDESVDPCEEEWRCIKLSSPGLLLSYGLNSEFESSSFT
jgi:hypothetical protein